ncbi:metabolite traffic protein EboE [Aliifodinibius salicampi]|uniref:Metabolite traffic protein EboE n=1 Tax=Fodinibius salicampi TaxID=1920655 RepID=A0ABT3PWM6_9BACT|nr:metabolite traffic protein EboE [Fodinibius salicampi]MCW9712201.1 metabolite traffic protein EboE [Fodinibius salicampi]
MKVGSNSEYHLTYCSNIHPGESWEEVFNQLKVNIPSLKERLAKDKAFGIGLRLSAMAARELREEEKLDEFREWLKQHDCYVFTMNGFPYGNFHGEVVKDKVYEPDWRNQARLDYTLNLIEILAELIPEDMDGGISTSPISYKPWLERQSERDEAFKQASKRLAECARTMGHIQEQAGKELHIDIEPEPDCLIENTAETVDFFTNWLFPEGAKYLSDQYNMPATEGERILRQHIRVCYDTCHFAVEYENPRETINAFEEAGIRIGKVQISAALKVHFKNLNQRQEVARKLQSFAEDTYLHQVVERRPDQSLLQYRDLDEALTVIYNEDGDEWRIHYHVPIFIDQFDGLESTQDAITGSLNILRERNDCTHFEIETYTWDVLPDHLKSNLLDSIEREYKWTLTHF